MCSVIIQNHNKICVNESSVAAAKNSLEKKSKYIIINMITASWCRPCQNTKNFLFGSFAPDSEEASAYFAQRIMDCFIRGYENNELFLELKRNIGNLSEEKKNLFLNNMKTLHQKESLSEMESRVFDLQQDDLDEIKKIYLGLILDLNKDVVFVYNIIDLDELDDGDRPSDLKTIPYFQVHGLGQSFTRSQSFQDKENLLNLLCPSVLKYIFN